MKMELRDKFALEAMKSMIDTWNSDISDDFRERLIKTWQKNYGENVYVSTSLANDAYNLADAMMKARGSNKREEDLLTEAKRVLIKYLKNNKSYRDNLTEIIRELIQEEMDSAHIPKHKNFLAQDISDRLITILLESNP